MSSVCSLHRLTLNAMDASCPSVVTIGNFDGLHLGHRQLLARVNEEAGARQAASCVLLFEPQPLEYFKQEQAPPRLMRLSDKLAGLRDLGVHRVAIARFDQRLAALTPKDFVEQVLLARLNACSVWVGDDFRFGAQRQGDFACLRALGQRLGFAVQQAPTYLLQGQRLSSTWLRLALSQGDLKQARAILGSDYRVCARVGHGEKLGRQLGFPTVNLSFRHRPAIQGVFVVRVHGLMHSPVWGVANVGHRPTVQGLAPRLEVHLLNWQGDAYGKKLCVAFVHAIRSERHFDSLAELKQQIQLDINDAWRFIHRQQRTGED